MINKKFSYATGRRKEASARIYLTDGKGSMSINGRSMEDYFPNKTLRSLIHQPLHAVDGLGKYDIKAFVKGSGSSGQAGAMRHGISRALLETDPTFNKALRDGGFLTRDARRVERKKYGRKKARKSFQFSKR